MNFLLSIPIRFALRYGRWMARGAGLAMGGLMFAAIERRDSITLPWMEEPYEFGVADPYIASVVAYIITVRVLVGVMMRFYGAAQDFVRQVRGS